MYASLHNFKNFIENLGELPHTPYSVFDTNTCLSANGHSHQGRNRSDQTGSIGLGDTFDSDFLLFFWHFSFMLYCEFQGTSNVLFVCYTLTLAKTDNLIVFLTWILNREQCICTYYLLRLFKRHWTH